MSRKADVPAFGDEREATVTLSDGQERTIRGRVVSKMRHSGHWWFSLQTDGGSVHKDIRGDRVRRITQ